MTQNVLKCMSLLQYIVTMSSVICFLKHFIPHYYVIQARGPTVDPVLMLAILEDNAQTTVNEIQERIQQETPK